MKKKVIIIGGGIAGLSSGVYALKNGFDVTILESHSIPGGNCTSWKRKGYQFEGGMHWLTGSGKDTELNKLWHYVGALDDSVVIHNKEPFTEFDFKGTAIRLYRDVNKTQEHLTELFPEDTAEIEKLCNSIRQLANNEMPDDVYASNFKSEGLKELFRSFIGDYQGPIPIFFFFTFGTFAIGDGGFPEGGSLPFAGRIAKTVTSLGGEILYNTKAEQVIVENGKAVGVLANNIHSNTTTKMDADFVVVTSDTMTIDILFEIPAKALWIDEMRRVTHPTMCTFISLGINADLKKYPTQYVFKLTKPINFVNHPMEYLHVNNYADDPNFSPAGKTAMTVILGGDTYDFWRGAKEGGTYEEEKQKLADTIIAAIEKQIPETTGKFEVIDVATPLTYERYCGTWKGSYMTAMTPEVKMEPYPPVVDNISRLYFAGQRMMPPGGFPIALTTARTAIEYLCKDANVVFANEGANVDLQLI
ncbi:MAG: NAD(P)/FAD-dependent oxidoreductase [Defluviitaleaceae bacterium]|nr:NAD(P)/FAD-dependent oxidoreductase [Defluviitaleaceae bacterium]